MHRLIIVLTSVVVGLLFIFFPSGTETITVYNDPPTPLLWYSADAQVVTKGTPFRTQLSGVPFSDYAVKAGLNFMIGSAVGLILSAATMKLIKLKKI